MPRARNIKFDFFRNEHLAELDPYARLLFIGLWTLADKEGRLEYRPKRIGADIFPYESVDVVKFHEDLSQAGFIRIYRAEGVDCIQIEKFVKHQKPHPNEKASELPPPPKVTDDGASSPIPENSRNSTSTRENAISDRAECGMLNADCLSNSARDAEPSPDESEASIVQFAGRTQGAESLELEPEQPPPESPPRKPERTKRRTNVPVKHMLETLPGLSETVAEDYLTHRKAKRAPLTETAWSGICRGIRKAQAPPDEALTMAMARGWQGFEADWWANSNKGNSNGNQARFRDPDAPQISAAERSARAIAAVRAREGWN